MTDLPPQKAYDFDTEVAEIDRLYRMAIYNVQFRRDANRRLRSVPWTEEDLARLQVGICGVGWRPLR